MALSPRRGWLPPLLADAALRGHIERNLQAFDLQVSTAPGLRRAAVAIAVAEEGLGAHLPGIATPSDWSTQASLILTGRSQNLGKHTGQWALPGGRIDIGEPAEEAALREAGEEIGLHLDQGCVLGRLDDYVTRSGFVITPVVVWAGAARSLAANPAEVASIHRIPVAEFMRADAPLLEPIADSNHPVLRMPVGDRWIAAPTAAMLYQFREVCISGCTTRVSHFEQPLFARK